MITMILTAMLAATQPAAAQVTTCQYPNTCKKAPVVRVAKAPVQTCQMPNTCSKRRAKPAARITLAKAIETCQMPNTCSR